VRRVLVHDVASPRAEFDQGKGMGNKEAFKKIVATGEGPGVLAYSGKEPIGWCAIAPRERYPVLARSRVLASVDQEPVWAVSCFFIAKPFRGQGVTEELLRSAVKYARRRGAKIVEGYPHDLSFAKFVVTLLCLFESLGWDCASLFTPCPLY
jgi:GNAT superfamily N-acetyltransferase